MSYTLCLYLSLSHIHTHMHNPPISNPLHRISTRFFTVDYRKLNAATITDGFPLLFTNIVLDTVAGHECYSILDGFSGYNQIRMHPEDQEKTTFVTEWGVFVAEVMVFGLKTAPAMFQRIITEIFHDYIPAFMQVSVLPCMAIDWNT